MSENIKRFEVRPFSSSTLPNSPQFKETDRVRLKKHAIHNGENEFPQGSVGHVADVNISPIDGSVAYVVNFHKKQDWAVVSPDNLMAAEKPKKVRNQTTSPKMPEWMK